MTVFPTDPEIREESRTGQRVLIGLGGLVLLALGTVITLGGALIGVVAITVAWFVKRQGERPLTRGVAWLVSVGTTIVPLVIFLIGTTLSAPTRTPEQMKKDVAAARAKQRDSMPAWLKRLPGGQPRTSAAADSVAEKLATNRGFMVWFTAMAAFVGSSLLGIFAGTVGWGVAMVLFRALKGEWMATAGSRQP